MLMSASAVVEKYYFFQTLTVTGGMLVLTEMGAGGLSLDERNKDL